MKTGIFFKIFFSLIILGAFLIAVFILLNYEELRTEIYLILFLVIVFIFAFALAEAQRFISPIKKLIEGTKEVKEGHLETRVYLKTKDELEDLARTFNQIAEDLEKSQAVVKEAKKVIEIKVRARTRELRKTIENLEEEVEIKTARLREFEKLTVGRELKMIELKKALRQTQAKIAKLKEELK